MSIRNTLENIRQKPEHIRMRYVFGSVAISLFFIGILWIFSIFSAFRQLQPNAVLNAPTLSVPVEALRSDDSLFEKQSNAPSLDEWIRK